MVARKQFKLFLTICIGICLLTLMFLIFSQHNSRTVQTKHRFLSRHELKSVHNSSISVKANGSGPLKIPKWVSMLSRSVREASVLSIESLQSMFADANFFSLPAIYLNSTSFKRIMGDSATKIYDSAYKVPNIVHLTWFYYPKRQAFRFHQVICLLSIQKHIKPEKILFWHDIEPVGKWWHYINGIVPNIVMVNRKAPNRIFNNRIRVPEHKADVARLEAVLAFGGIYMDLDVIALNSFTPLRKQNVTLGAESPNSLGNGVISSAPHSTFLWLVYYNYYSFDDRKWDYHSVKLPMKLATMYPSLLNIEWDSILRPNWSETKWIFMEGKLWDWEDNYCIHLSYRFHDYEYDPNSIRKLNTTMGEVFRYIYYGDSSIID